MLGLIFAGLSATWVSAAELTATPENAQESRAPYVTPEVVKSWLEQGRAVTFLDVRAADEFVAGHIQDAINIHYDQVDSLADQLPRDKPIILYCIHSAHRAPEAAKTLRQLGFQNAYVMEGGVVAWQVAGLPIQASNLAKTPTILPKTERCDNAAKDPPDTNQVVAHESGS
jgi:rhodanese-related sulfurtransferase